ncbi:hypothetical protein WA026_021111 [Henosepilachna vigintioctopunctata]|uniref:PHD-type domain-containing protein n=1 Tax=Henosepilachna vigintioctopunctata TaxID=420089 RepID=A0AAW1UXV1_9CUCU
MSSFKCVKCNYEIKRNMEKIICAVCENKYHTNCVDLNEEEIKFIADKSNIKYYCEGCNETSTIVELKKMLGECLNKIEEQSNKMEKYIKFIEANVPLPVNQKTNTQKKSYTDVLLIKPIKGQKSNVTREDIASKIDPGELKLAIDVMKNIKNGEIMIGCDSNKTKEIISSKVSQELGNKYTVVEASLKNPRIVIRGVEERYMEQEDEQIVRGIIEQNDLKIIDESIESKMKIVRKYTNKSKNNSCNLLLDIDSKLYDIIKKGKNSMLDGGNALSQIIIIKIEKLNIKIEINHKASDPECPRYKRIIESIQKKINYGDK